MKTLIVTTVPPPVPGLDVHGVYKRLGMFIRALSEISSSLRILYVPLATPNLSVKAEAPELRDLAAWGVHGVANIAPSPSRPTSLRDLLSFPFFINRRPRFRPFSEKAAARTFHLECSYGPDVILLHRLSSTVLSERWSDTKAAVFFDLDDIEHRVKARGATKASNIGRALWELLQVPALFGAERAVIRSVAASFVCSDEDKAYLARVGMKGHVEVVPNAIDFPDALQPANHEGAILFLGGYQYPPNALAAQRLITRIWPSIQQAFPHVQLFVAGASPELIPAFHSDHSGVHFLGFVQDLRDLYFSVSLVCCPIEIGGGTRVKLIEAAAFGKPIVSTTIGAEGLAFTDEQEILIRDTDASIAEACVSLLRDPTRAQKLGLLARSKSRELYELSSVVARIQSIVTKTLYEERRDGSPVAASQNRISG